MRSTAVRLLSICILLPATRLSAASPGFTIEDVKPLSAAERKAQAFKLPQQDKLEIKGGNYVKNGKPAFLLGTIQGTRQFRLKAMWTLRLQKIDFSDPAGYGEMPLRASVRNGQVVVKWGETPFFATMINELLRHRVFAMPDVGSDTGGTTLNRVLPHLKSVAPSAVPLWHETINPLYGHFNGIDSGSALGQQLYENIWYSHLRSIEQSGIRIAGIELWNETGYNAFSPSALAAYRVYLQRKYARIATLNRVCRTEFKAFADVLPPHLWDAEYAYNVTPKSKQGVDGRFRMYKIQQAAAYPELWNDWIEFCRIRFAENYKVCSARLRRRYRDPTPLFLDARLERRYRRAHYETIDIERLCSTMDLFGHHIPGGSVRDYGGHPAEPDGVLQSMIVKTLYQDYSRNICAKPIVNTECIVGRVGAVGVNVEGMLSKSMAPLQAQWQRASKRPSADGWRRFEFSIARRYTTTRDMDHLSFFLTGGGFDGPIRLRLNGEIVCETSKPDRRFKRDVSFKLRYGTPNTLDVHFERSKADEGHAEYLALVNERDLSGVSRDYGPKEVQTLLWQHAVHGFAGINYWKLRDRAKLEAVIPQVKADLVSVADVLMPRPRIKGRAAILYPWESFAGLCHTLDLVPEFKPFMNYYGGLLFNRIATDVLSCRQIIAGKHRKYDLLVVPYAELVRKGTFEAIHSYVSGGGTLLLTHKSLVKDDHFYENLPVERLIGQPASETVTTRRIGRGTVYYVPKDLEFSETHRLIGEILEKQRIGKDLDIAFQQNEEFPFVEAQIIGQPDRFLVYLMNWGGMPQRGRLRILPRFLGRANGTRYRVRHLQQRRAVGTGPLSAAALTAGVEVEIPVQTPTVYVFESEKRAPLHFVKPAEQRMGVLREIERWKRKRPRDKKRPAVLVLFEPGRTGKHEMGIWTSPIAVDLLRKAGCEVHERSRAELREEGLANYDVLFIQEDYKFMWSILMRDKAFVASIREFVEGGGGLFVCGIPQAFSNNQSLALKTLLRPEKVGVRGGWFSDPGSCVNGDPLQVVFSDVRAHPVTRDVKRLATLFAAPLNDPESALTPLIFSRKADRNAPGQPVLLAGNLGKGRVVVSGDTFFMQPFRIEEADNLRLAWNIFTWLSKGRIPDVPTAALRKRLMFTEQQVQTWEEAEGF